MSCKGVACTKRAHDMSNLDGFRGPALLNSSSVWDHTVRALFIASMDHIHLRIGSFSTNSPHIMSLMLLPAVHKLQMS